MHDSVSVLIPWREEQDPYRRWALRWVCDRYREAHPDWEIILGECSEGPFNRAEAILDAAGRTSADVLCIGDADVWCEGLDAAVHAVGEHGWGGVMRGAPWAVPHTLIHRLSRESTDLVLDGADWRGLPLSTDNRQDSKPYKGHEAGTLLVIRRETLEEVPPDRRFVGWGGEDDAWACALRSLIGPPWRGSDDVVHLWHEPQPRMTRIVGNERSKALLARYRSARRDPDAMSALLAEVNEEANA